MPRQHHPVSTPLLPLGTFYFTVFLSHSIWRVTFHNNAVNVFGLDGEILGMLFSINYLPGVLCFAIGFAASRVRVDRLLIASCLLLAGGFITTSIASDFSGLALGTLLIAFGLTCFYTVANGACLIDSTDSDAPIALSRLKSLGPLAGLAAAIIILGVFAPRSLSDAATALRNGNAADILHSLLATPSAPPEIHGQTLRILIFSLGAVLLLPGCLPGRDLKRRAAHYGYGSLRLRRQLIPYYTLNFLAGCRSGIFQTFALFVMIAHFQLQIHGTAALVLAGYICSFFGYRAVGMALTRFSHRAVLTTMYSVVAVNFLCFCLLMNSQLHPQQALPALAILFIIDSGFFGISVVTDSHLKKTGEQADYVGDISIGMTLFSLAAVLTSFAGGVLWQTLGAMSFLLGALVCLGAAVMGRRL
jgi:predicted MFS family arabinose efflux permease